MSTEQLFEVVQSKSLNVDHENNVIRNVKILGKESANGRTYTGTAIREAAELYEGIGVFIDHPPRSAPNTERRVNDRVGWLEGISLKNDGLYGDLHVLKSNPSAALICEAAERNPRLIGLSHNAEGRTRRERGKTLVEKVTRVRSVDLVTDPATTRGLFESEEIDMPKKKTVRQIAESLDKKIPEVKLLLEVTEEGAPMAAAADAPVEAAPEAGSADQMKAAFRAAVMAAFDDESLDTKATLKKIGEVLKAYEKLTSKPEQKVDDAAGSEEEETSAAESKDPDLAAKVARLEARDQARDLIESAGIVPESADKREVMIESLASLKSEDSRKALLETWKSAKPTAGGPRPRSGKPVMESKGEELPETAEDFARALLS